MRGVRRDASLGRLPLRADSSRIIDQIAGQFGFTRAQVLELARKFRLEESSPREEWLAVYDRLQAVNRDHFKRLDSKKYDGWTSFRRLADKSYPPGWRGTLLRLSELHKHFLGAAIRFPYHLFDMFVFGYFRQAIAFEFFHSTESGGTVVSTALALTLSEIGERFRVLPFDRRLPDPRQGQGRQGADRPGEEVA